MISGYTHNLSVQILVDLLLKHGIRKAVVSPGTTDLEFIVALQFNGGFEIYSSIDERSAAYMACGIADEFGEPVIIACTEATASRNYFPGLTEAYYRKLPIIAVTGIHRYYQIGTLFPQVIDRHLSPGDIAIYKAQLPVIKDKEDAKHTELLVNKALLAAKSSNPGPVHIDLPCCNDNYDFSCKELYDAHKIERYEVDDKFPDLPKGNVAVYIGSHRNFTENETKCLDAFCASNDAVVFCDHTSGYHGKYAFHAGLLSVQRKRYEIMENIACLIHLGEQMADWPTMTKLKSAKTTWRVSPDGELRDTFGNLSKVFKMTLTDFLKQYTFDNESKDSYLKECKAVKKSLRIPIETLPLSNVYTAAKMSAALPSDSILHMGASNTVRAWSMFDLPEGVKSYGNVGCRGIDGVMSSAVGAALADKRHLHFCVVGDLMFYYDMNCLGNRDIAGNLRVLLINNNGGGIFKQSVAPGYKYFGDRATDDFIAAANHFGRGENKVVKNYVESLGFKYLFAKSKEEFDATYETFVSTQNMNSPILFEVFTKDYDDRTAFDIINSIDAPPVNPAKQVAKQLLGQKGISFVKKITGR